MASRHRQSTAPRHSLGATATPTPGPSGSARVSAATTLPPYRKPSHPLNRNAQNKLGQIYSSSTSQSLKDHNNKATQFLTDAAGSIYDHVRDREDRIVRRRKKWEKGLNTERQDEEERELAELQQSVDTMTKKLEESMRGAIDAGEAAQRIEDGIKWVRENAPGRLEQEHATQMSQRQSQSQAQSQARSRRQRDEDGDEDMDDEEDVGPTPGPTPLNQERVALTGLSEMFTDRMERKKDEYFSFSHGTRYSKNNAYIGFKSMVHDAKYGDNGPPLPHADTWFTERGSPAPGVTQTQGDADDDDDIVVDKATVSIRCPLTFLPFKEPYTSKKCPHTFEKSAILQLIRNSNTRTGGGAGRGHGDRVVQCPVPGCDQGITVTDLHEDLVLIRKINRMQKAEAQAADESDLEDNPAPAKERRADEESDAESVVPATQVPPRSSAIVDLGDPSDEDDDE